MERLLAWGVDALISNRPDLAVSVRDRFMSVGQSAGDVAAIMTAMQPPTLEDVLAAQGARLRAHAAVAAAAPPAAR